MVEPETRLSMADATPDYISDRYSTYVSLPDTDAFTVLYWGAPVDWAQSGYENLMRTIGHPIEEALHQDWDIPVANMVIEYYQPLRLGDRIDVETSVVEVGNRSMRMESRVLREDGSIAVRVARVHVAVKRAGGAAQLPDWLRALGPARPTAGREG